MADDLRVLYLDKVRPLDLEVLPALADLPLQFVPEVASRMDVAVGHPAFWSRGLRFLWGEALYQSEDPYSVYQPRASLMDQIWDETASGRIHFVVIGNNTGAGFQKAAMVAPRLRSRTIITGEADRHLYWALGYKNFASRIHLAQRLRSMIDANQYAVGR